MDFYKTIKKAAVAGFLVALPTVCDPSCGYNGNKIYAAEIKREVNQEAVSTRVPEMNTETIEAILR